jgi:apolipoprotein N-acyltransferase
MALTPLLLVLTRGSLTRAFFLGLTTGVLYFAGTVYWLTQVMARYGGLETWVGVLINLALVAYLALFPALFAVVVRRLEARFGVLALMTAPLVWVATEVGRTYLLTGFPWVLLGYSQASVLPVAQLASLTGVYGLSGLVAAVSAGLAVFALEQSAVKRLSAVMAPIAIVAIVAVWGSARVARSELTRTGDAIRIGLIQGNVNQDEKWDADKAGAIFSDYLRMTEAAIAQGAQAVAWPEASTPFFFEEDRLSSDRVREIARRSAVSILVGSDQLERGVQPRLYNAAFAVGPDGSTAAVYRKMHLVPFGEYVPLPRLFFFAAPLVEAVGSFSRGEEMVLLPLNGHRVSTAICYEVVYPRLVRRSVEAGSELLTTITNDAWFGRSSAPYQHFVQASMRAIENGRYLVRAANTGISGVVDPYGRTVASSRIFEPAVIVAEARFLDGSTFYVRHGDVFAYAAVIVTLAMLVVARRRVQ